MELFERLKNIRISRGLTQKDVADFLNMHPASYANYENGKRTPDIQTLTKIADYYKLSIDLIMGRDNINSNSQIILKPEYKSKLHEEIHKKIDLLNNQDLLFLKRILDTIQVREDNLNLVGEK